MNSCSAQARERKIAPAAGVKTMRASRSRAEKEACATKAAQFQLARLNSNARARHQRAPRALNRRMIDCALWGVACRRAHLCKPPALARQPHSKRHFRRKQASPQTSLGTPGWLRLSSADSSIRHQTLTAARNLRSQTSGSVRNSISASHLQGSLVGIN